MGLQWLQQICVHHDLNAIVCRRQPVFYGADALPLGRLVFGVGARRPTGSWLSLVPHSLGRSVNDVRLTEPRLASCARVAQGFHHAVHQGPLYGVLFSFIHLTDTHKEAVDCG